MRAAYLLSGEDRQFSVRGLVAIALLCIALLLGGKGAWIHMKAILAQHLIAQAWQGQLADGSIKKPWPWADTWPVARLKFTRGDIDQYVLAGARGNSLAFGPGKVIETNNTKSPSRPSEYNLGNSSMTKNPTITKGTIDELQGVVAGHRDTHFKFLKNLQLDDVIEMQAADGHWKSFRVSKTAVHHIERDYMNILPQQLLLVTCYPFSSLGADGPLRYVVTLVASEVTT